MSKSKTGVLIFNSRVVKRLSLQDIAKETGVSHSYIAYIEKGKRKASVVFLKKVCKVLSIDEDDIKKAVIDDFTDKFMEEWG